MTQATATTATTTFAEAMRLFNSELIPLLVGKKVLSATAGNNLPYTDKAKKTTPKTGIWVSLEGETQPIGLFRWDLMVRAIEVVDGKNQAVVLEDTLHKTARETLKPNISEKAWFDAIANAIVGKTVGSRRYFGKSANGSTYEGVILTID